MVRVIASKDKRIPVGAKLSAINNQEIDDFLEFKFYNDDSKTRQLVVELNGTSRRVVFKPHAKIAVTLESPRYRECTNGCDFCFIKGLPRNLRKELYFRDDDYRLSFLFGNFLSLTNLDKQDISRIGKLRLSPLYISVHTTNSRLRVKLFKNEKAGLILQTLQALADNDIKMHCQIVVIPGVNSGRHLVTTIKDLSRLYPAVDSIGIVPVGKTKYAEAIPSVSKRLAQSVIDTGRRLHERFRKRHNRGFVYLADELYIKTGNPIPPKEYYDDFPQYENGIGMVRSLLDEINMIGKVKSSKGRFLILTGYLANPFLQILKAHLEPNISVDIKAVANEFFGETVTVSGLISGQDINRTIKQSGNKYDRIILPPNCVNDARQFLDNVRVRDQHVLIAPKTVKELIRCLR